MRVFLSYRQADRELASKIAQELQKSGYHVDDLLADVASTSIRTSLKKLIARSDAIVMLLPSDGSDIGGWMQYETGAASALDKPLVALTSPDVPRTAIPFEIIDSPIIRLDPNDMRQTAEIISDALRVAA